MTALIPTEEQQKIIDAAQNQDNNLAVVARAGAAKTSTLIMIAEALPNVKILCLAFNKKIATEMQERLPDNCEAKTLHALGYKAWFGFIRKKCNIHGHKNYRILKELIDNLPAAEKKTAYKEMGETLDYINKGKAVGYLPDSFKGHWKALTNDAQFFASLPLEPSELQETLIKKASKISFQQALTGDIDFDDMIMCPALCGVSWPNPPLTLIDEAQDLSKLNHHMLKKIVKKKRIIAVGDPCQAIYGFRGADADSLPALTTAFDMEEFYLTISFRCARAIVENARWRAPDMKYPDWAIEGSVSRPMTWSSDDIQDGDAIICRNNAPLFSLAIKLLYEGRLPRIAGREIGPPLLKIMKSLGPDALSSKAAKTALEQWRDKQIQRARDGAVGQIRDKYECILIMIKQTSDLGDAKAYLQAILNREGRIDLMTGHRSKGLEFDNVFFLDQQLCVIKQDQDANIKYVIETRAKNSLAYVDYNTFQTEADDD